MAGHSHWKQIKVQKGSADEKRAKIFSKLLKAVSVAAKAEPNPQFNPRLRTAIQKAKDNQVPQENIERAIKRATEQSENLEEIIVEAYGPGGVAILITAITDNSNRTINEIKLSLKDFDGKLSVPGGVRWVFETKTENSQEMIAKFLQPADEPLKSQIIELTRALEALDDVQKVYTNAK